MVLYAYLCCVCVFSLRQESSDMILGGKPLISDVILSQGAKRAVFERHEKLGQHMKPLYIKGKVGTQGGGAHEDEHDSERLFRRGQQCERDHSQRADSWEQECADCFLCCGRKRQV
jgi:hypothetical protein